MPEEMTIPPCPFCGCKDIIELEGFNPVWMKCGKCGSYAKKDIWNRRTPEPGTSIVWWVEYGDKKPPCDTRLLAGFRKSGGSIPHIDVIADADNFAWRDSDLWAYLPEPPEGM